MAYEAKRFTISRLAGISEESVRQHIALYEGYVKNFNTISEELPEYAKDSEKHAHALSELIRRRSFEFGGMRLHEYYFPQFEGGARALRPESALAKQIERDYRKIEYFEIYFKAIGNMRGPGWAMLYWDEVGEKLLAGFTGEQHQGHFVTLPIVLALDVWEHTYLLDHGASGRGVYLDAFFKNLNWGVVEKRFEDLLA